MTGATAPERLNRFLARRGVSSRRGADALIAAGRITINGAPATLGMSVNGDADQVSLDGRLITPAAPRMTLMLNKPSGVVTTRTDTHHRATVMELVEHIPGLVPVGRLDADSHGLLLLSTDGDLAHRLTHPSYGIRKHYQIRLARPPTESQLRDLAAGRALKDGFARPLAVELPNHVDPAVIEVVMGEGRKREVRRLCAAVGMTVVDLGRTAFGPLRLGALREGRSRRLTGTEIEAVYRAVQLTAPQDHR